ncbi:MAG: UMP kinase [Candidatus Pacebacteria bacterium]|nr:UMP kinase [Candidatus Paceibacterota bacterium]
MDKKNYIIVSLGGSIIIPEKIDVDFLKVFIQTIKDYIDKGYKFVIITGGGKVCRLYNDSLEQIASPTDEDLDWLGISVTRLNAELLRFSFGDEAYEKILLNPDEIPETNKSIIVGGGWKPGNSSDLAAVHVANKMGISKLINLSNIDFVYDKDPKIFPDAKEVRKISWSKLRDILPDSWTPGINAPFDPVAARRAEEIGLEVVIMNGKNINNLRDYLDGKEFIGTVIN